MRYGLGAVKGTGQAAVEAIVDARKQGGPFTSLFDFCRRVDRHQVNKRTIEALVRAGAFDSIDENRAALLASIGAATEAAEQAERSANQSSLFADDSNDIVEGEVAKVAPWSLQDRLRQEKTALGFYFSGHLFDAWRDEVRRFAPTPLARLEASRSPQWFAGVLSAVRVRMTRRGKMLYAMLDDGSAQLEVAIFNELFEEHRQRLKEDQLIIIQGKVSNDDYTGGLRINADAIFDLQLAREARASCLSIGLNNNADAQRLQTLLAPHRAQEQGGVPVEVQLQRPDYECVVQLGPQWRVRLADSLLEQLEDWDATHEVEISYR
jgi:DNA polymerase-3 subunit alpha